MHARLWVCLCASLEKESDNCFSSCIHDPLSLPLFTLRLYSRGLSDKRSFCPVSHYITVGIASIHILYLVLNLVQNLIRLYCINIEEQKKSFDVMSLILSDMFLADVARCVGSVCLTESCRPYLCVWLGFGLTLLLN